VRLWGKLKDFGSAANGDWSVRQRTGRAVCLIQPAFYEERVYGDHRTRRRLVYRVLSRNPGANCQSGTKDEARQNLAEGIELILKDRREDALHWVPPMRFERLSRSNEAEHGAISNDKEVLTRYGRTREPALSKRFLVTPKFLTALSKKFVVLFRSRKLRNIPV